VKIDKETGAHAHPAIASVDFYDWKLRLRFFCLFLVGRREHFLRTSLFIMMVSMCRNIVVRSYQ
jgi:hypothetical protein